MVKLSLCQDLGKTLKELELGHNNGGMGIRELAIWVAYSGICPLGMRGRAEMSAFQTANLLTPHLKKGASINPKNLCLFKEDIKQKRKITKYELKKMYDRRPHGISNLHHMRMVMIFGIKTPL